MDSHFQQYSSWSFEEIQQKLELSVAKLVQNTINDLPADFYQHPYLHLNWMKKQKLYEFLQFMPKGVLHHDHFQCNYDRQFFFKYIINDSIVFVNQQRDKFYIGKQQQAKQKQFISMQHLKNEQKNQQQMLKIVSNMCIMSNEDYINSKGDATVLWQIFESKIQNFFTLLKVTHIFKKYVFHILNKFIRNGYHRVQFRAQLINLTQYNKDGSIVKVHSKNKYAQLFDQVFNQIKKLHPNFSVGFIFFGRLSFTPENNKKMIRQICQLNWDKTVAIDFVQEQDPYGSLQPYDNLANEVFSEYPHLNYKKVYHCGQTKNHKNKNIQISIKAGVVRIGHGNNAVQWPQVLQKCIQDKICFQKSLISNLVFRYNYDARFDATQILFGLGIPISINPDDPGTFGYDDTTCDFFVAAVSYNWLLRHLKVIGLHSINYSVVEQKTKKQIEQRYSIQWVQWAQQQFKKID